jgi:hypothetical protein
MKAILSAALVLGLCGPAGARDTKADPVGTWKCGYDIGGQKRESTLVIKKDGDKLTGTMTYQDKQEAKLKDLKFQGGELTFSAERKVMDNTQGEGSGGRRGREAGVRLRGQAGEVGQVTAAAGGPYLFGIPHGSAWRSRTRPRLGARSGPGSVWPWPRPSEGANTVG